MNYFLLFLPIVVYSSTIKDIVFDTNKKCSFDISYMHLENIFTSATFFMNDHDKELHLKEFYYTTSIYFLRLPKKPNYIEFCRNVILQGLYSSCYFKDDIKYFSKNKIKIKMFTDYYINNNYTLTYILKVNLNDTWKIKSMYKFPDKYWKFY